MTDSAQSDISTPTKPRPTVRRKRGPKVPTNQGRTLDTTKLDQFGFRLGSLKAKAAALYATKKGATLGEVKQTLKSTQFNVLTELEHKGYKVERVPVSGFNDRKVTRYHVVVK